MFTGIIEEVGFVKGIQMGSNSGILTIKATKILEDVNLGDSISTNGVCLTVTKFNEQEFSVDVMPRTMELSNLGDLKIGDEVNLERALSLNSRLGGHIVTGHIDTTAVISSLKPKENAILFGLTIDDYQKRLVVKRGSISIDGISLTLADVTKKEVVVSVLPHTYANTVLRRKGLGNKVNIEYDALGKFVQRNMEIDKEECSTENKSNIDMEFLRTNNFI